MAKQILRLGIMSREDFKQRTIAIARGEYQPKKHEPKVWFESLQSMAQVLSNENQLLLKVILEEKPKSLRDLEEMTGRRRSNLSRTLKTMAQYGIVDLVRQNKYLQPVVKITDFQVSFGLG